MLQQTQDGESNSAVTAVATKRCANRDRLPYPEECYILAAHPKFRRICNPWTRNFEESVIRGKNFKEPETSNLSIDQVARK